MTSSDQRCAGALGDLFLDTSLSTSLSHPWKMTSRNFLEGKFLKPPDETPRRPKEKVERKPKPQRKQSKQQQQQQQEQEEQPSPGPQPYRKPTLGELLQNPPRFPSPPAKGTPKKAKVQFVLPETEPKKKRRRRATLYDVIARMSPILSSLDLI